MDATEKMGSSSSSSSLASDLFGSKDSSGSPSSGIFGSIFSPSSKALGRESLHFETAKTKRGGASQESSTKPGPQDQASHSTEIENESATNRDLGAFYQEQRMQPCHLSSSIYYGGQDIYRSHPQSNTHNPGYTTVNKDGVEDDSGSASRGNWWQGSLYY